MLLHMPPMVPACPDRSRWSAAAEVLARVAPRPYPARTHVRRDGAPQPRAASGRGAPRRPAAGRGGGRLRQDLDARLPGRPPGRSRRPARADPAADVHAPRRPRDALARRAADRRPRARPGLGRHVPRDRQPAAPAPRRSARPVPRLHRPRPDRHGRPDGPDPRRARARPGRAAVPAQGHARRRLLAHRERRDQARRGARDASTRGARRKSRRSARSSSATPSASARRARSTTTTCSCSGTRSAVTRPRGPRSRQLFDHILVDEYQDTNPLQADILASLRPTGDGLMVVGDDAQAIYAFRSATVANILEFPTRFPGTTIVKLERNYRSTRPILEATNAVIALSPQRHEKTLWTERVGGAAPLAAHLHRRARPGRRGVPVDPRAPRARHAAARAGGAVPRRSPQRRARGRADAAQHPVREVRRAEVPRVGARQGRARGAPDRGQPARRGVVVPRAPAARPRRAGRGPTRDGRDRRVGARATR